jgi:DNA polymerase elongation subunit (family B)
MSKKMKIKPMHSFRLISFNTYDEEEPSDDGEGTQPSFKEKDYKVQMFGINDKGETASIIVEGFTPYFYVKVENDWDQSKMLAFIAQVKQEIGAYYEKSILKPTFVKKNKLYGFDGGTKHTFILMKFQNEATMRKVKNLWYTSAVKKGVYQRTLNPEGYMCKENATSTYLYEAQIPPLLRLFHIRDISPSGWISLPTTKARKIPKKTRKTHCTHEFIINYKHIVSKIDKETPVPYKICSFDIEASSSHGDFPLAKKDYKKLAMNIVDGWRVRSKEYDIDKTQGKIILKQFLKTAFSIGNSNVENIEKVYPKCPLKENNFIIAFENWFETVLDDYNKDKNIFIQINNSAQISESQNCEEGYNNNETDNARQSGWWTNQKRLNNKVSIKGNIVDVLNDDKIDRETKINIVNKTLNEEYMFPRLEGDKVTFIGSTFWKYGDDAPYLNHCAVLDTCSELPNIENSKIDSYKTEREVLLAWQKIIQEEDPDIIIGYNIFGFDYPFMYERAKELNCVDQFVNLSRNKGERCLKTDWKSKKETLEESTLYIASGQHDLKYIKMNGRIQIDMYNYFRRDYQLMMYKLDYVSGYFIGDGVKKYEHISGNTKIYSENLTGLENYSFINFEEAAHSVDFYKDGKKFRVFDINYDEGSFYIEGNESPDMKKKVRWGLAKDDVTPQDIFRMTNEGPNERAVIAKYCIQDCNLVQHLLRKIDVITGFTEMSRLCSVPIDFLVLRGQGIKLTSYIAKKCREKDTLMPVIEKGSQDEAYEGAIVLAPKCDLYLDDPVACVDYSSLYPSSMISENISHDSKVWSKEYDLDGRLINETGEKDNIGEYKYDNLPDYKYVDIEYDTYEWRKKNSSASSSMEKVHVGTKICRFAQFPEGKAIMPSILEELLKARKDTRKQIPHEKDEFKKNVLDKRQLSIKVTANSMYGQTGAKTSTFYEMDCAASTTAIGRKLLTYAKRVIEEAYNDIVVTTKNYGDVKINAEYVYGDTDSVFFKFNPSELDGTKIIGQKALEITIELAQQAGELATKFLKNPHDLEYEKTFMPFCLLSKKRYVGMLYELDPHKCKRKSMGIVLKRRDNAPIVKDVYGGIIDILMKEKKVESAAAFLTSFLQKIVDGKIIMNKLIITKSLKSDYKNPEQIAHKVLADRIGKRDPGSKPSVGDRVAYVYIKNKNKKALQGERIEIPSYIKENKLEINYAFYITNQIMKPVQQVFSLVLEKLGDFKKRKGHTLRRWHKELEQLYKEFPDPEKRKQKEDALRNKEVKALLFDKYIQQTMRDGSRSITEFFS